MRVGGIREPENQTEVPGRHGGTMELHGRENFLGIWGLGRGHHQYTMVE